MASAENVAGSWSFRREPPDPRGDVPGARDRSHTHEGHAASVSAAFPAISIAGGTDEIRRNIIAERVPALPKEPQMDRGPFPEVRN